MPGGMVPPHIQQQMGGTAPFPPSGPNYFNLPGPGGAAYPSMDPQQAGTRCVASPTDWAGGSCSAEALPWSAVLVHKEDKGVDSAMKGLHF